MLNSFFSFSYSSSIRTSYTHRIRGCMCVTATDAWCLTPVLLFCFIFIYFDSHKSILRFIFQLCVPQEMFVYFAIVHTYSSLVIHVDVRCAFTCRKWRKQWICYAYFNLFPLKCHFHTSFVPLDRYGKRKRTKLAKIFFKGDMPTMPTNSCNVLTHVFWIWKRKRKRLLTCRINTLFYLITGLTYMCACACILIFSVGFIFHFRKIENTKIFFPTTIFPNLWWGFIGNKQIYIRNSDMYNI